MFGRILKSACAATVAVAALNSAAMLRPAQACPMCAQANEAKQAEENPRPKAYMYSILFMMAMPAMIFTGFGVGLYRLSKKGQTIDAGVENSVTTEE